MDAVEMLLCIGFLIIGIVCGLWLWLKTKQAIKTRTKLNIVSIVLLTIT
jgi:hypothetical protein